MSVVLRGLGGRGLVTQGLGDTRSVTGTPPVGVYKTGQRKHIGIAGEWTLRVNKAGA